MNAEKTEPKDSPVVIKVAWREIIFQLRYLLIAAMASMFIFAMAFLVIAKYPFKTLDYRSGVVTDSDQKVPNGGVVHIDIDFKKYTSAPGLVVRTMYRKKGKDIIPLDSNTLISHRGPSEGIAHATFVMNSNHENVGTDTYISFTTFYNLYGFIPRMVSIEVGPFEIINIPAPPGCSPRDNQGMAPLEVRKFLIAAGIISAWR